MTEPQVQRGCHYRTRVREHYVRDHVVPLINRRAAGAARLDLVLRVLAARPDDKAEAGRVPGSLSWNQLHDLVRRPDFYQGTSALKRKWISDKLRILEDRGLVRRLDAGTIRPEIVVLRDDGSGQPFDDPTGQGRDSYVTVLGSLVQYGRVASWGGPDLAVYYSALTAERYARSDTLMVQRFRLEDQPLGGGPWYRPLRWFADESGSRPDRHVRYGFSLQTLQRGVRSLEEQGLIARRRIHVDPRTGRAFRHETRMLYFNGFNEAAPNRRRIAPSSRSIDAETRALHEGNT